MAKDATQIVVAASGTIWTAPLTTTAPTTATAAPVAAWVDLGYATEDGVTLSDTKDIEELRVWQEFYPMRRIITGRTFTVTFALRQWSDDHLKFAFGGGTVTTPVAGTHKYVPPSASTLDERELMIDWKDGTKNYRLVIPRGLVIETVETNLVRTDGASLPITFGVLGEASVDPWYVLSDDPAMTP